MAVWGIRTAWGPEATEERREYKLAMDKQQERLKLEKERTKQITKGDAAVAAAVMGSPAPFVPPTTGFLGLDFMDPTTQVTTGLVLVGGALLAKRAGYL